MTQNPFMQSYQNCYENEFKENTIERLGIQNNELAQYQRDLDTVSLKLQNVQKENSILIEEKLSLEYEFRQMSLYLNKQLEDLQEINYDLQAKNTEKTRVNKKLFSDNNNFFKLVESKDKEIQDLCYQNNILRSDLDSKLKEIENLKDTLEKSNIIKNKSILSIEKEKELTSLRHSREIYSSLMK